MGFRNKDLRKKLGKNWETAKVVYELRKLRVRGVVKKLQNTQYYQFTQEGYSIFNYSYFVNPLYLQVAKRQAKHLVTILQKLNRPIYK